MKQLSQLNETNELIETKELPAMTEIYQGEQDYQDKERKNGDRRYSLEGAEESCETPVQNSLTVSPNEEMALVSTNLENSSNQQIFRGDLVSM